MVGAVPGILGSFWWGCIALHCIVTIGKRWSVFLGVAHRGHTDWGAKRLGGGGFRHFCTRSKAVVVLRKTFISAGGFLSS